MNDIAYLMQRFEFEKNINEVYIKRTILKHIVRNTENPVVVKALQDLFLDIYVCPEDVFEDSGASRLLAELDKKIEEENL